MKVDFGCLFPAIICTSFVLQGVQFAPEYQIPRLAGAALGLAAFVVAYAALLGSWRAVEAAWWRIRRWRYALKQKRKQ